MIPANDSRRNALFCLLMQTTKTAHRMRQYESILRDLVSEAPAHSLRGRLCNARSLVGESIHRNPLFLDRLETIINAETGEPSTEGYPLSSFHQQAFSLLWDANVPESLEPPSHCDRNIDPQATGLRFAISELLSIVPDTGLAHLLGNSHGDFAREIDAHCDVEKVEAVRDTFSEGLLQRRQSDLRQVLEVNASSGLALLDKMESRAQTDPAYREQLHCYYRHGGTLKIRELAEPFGGYVLNRHPDDMQLRFAVSAIDEALHTACIPRATHPGQMKLYRQLFALQPAIQALRESPDESVQSILQQTLDYAVIDKDFNLSLCEAIRARDIEEIAEHFEDPSPLLLEEKEDCRATPPDKIFCTMAQIACEAMPTRAAALEQEMTP